MGRVANTVVDSDGDRGSNSIPIVSPDPTGSDYTTWRANARALLTAMEAIQRSVPAQRTLEAEVEDVPFSQPTDGDVQNNDVWVLEFRVVGMNGPRYTHTIPGADRSKTVNRNGRRELELASGDGATFKAAFEEVYEWPGTLDNPSAAAVGGQNPGEALLDVVYVKGT